MSDPSPPSGTRVIISHTLGGKTPKERSAQIGLLLLTLQAGGNLDRATVKTATEEMTGEEALKKWSKSIKKAVDLL